VSCNDFSDELDFNTMYQYCELKHILWQTEMRLEVATLPFSSRTVAYWLFASGHDARLQRPVKLNSFRQNF